MAQFRLESVLDHATRRYFVEVYHDSEDVPFVVGNPIYLSHEHAMADAVAIFKTAMPDQPLTGWTE